jgi:hypothetical protein
MSLETVKFRTCKRLVYVTEETVKIKTGRTLGHVSE